MDPCASPVSPASHPASGRKDGGHEKRALAEARTLISRPEGWTQAMAIRRRRIIAPTPPKPRIISVQDAGSGTPAESVAPTRPVLTRLPAELKPATSTTKKRVFSPTSVEPRAIVGGP